MDKYQKFYIDDVLCKNGEKIIKCVYAEDGEEVCGEVNFENLTITVNQVEDITKTVYRAVLKAWEVYWLKCIEVNYGKGWEKLDYKGTVGSCEAYYEIPLDFENRITEVKIVPADDIADGIVLKVVYNEADKELYYKKQAEADRREIIKKAHIECLSCMNFIQVYFVPCNENYGNATLTLYRGDDQFMYKYESLPGQFCISAMGLGHGEYTFIFRQYDKKQNLIFETDRVKVKVDDTSRRNKVL